LPTSPQSFRLGTHLRADRILDLKSTSKEEALREMVDVLRDAPEVTDLEDFYKAILQREKTMSTGLGIGLALPHVKIPSVRDFVVVLGRKREGIEFESLDKKPAYIIILVGASQKQHKEFLLVIARIAQLFRDENVRDEILNAESREEILEIIQKHEVP